MCVCVLENGLNSVFYFGLRETFFPPLRRDETGTWGMREPIPAYGDAGSGYSYHVRSRGKTGGALRKKRQREGKETRQDDVLWWL